MAEFNTTRFGPSNDVIRAACHQYFLSQQALQSAESETIHLEKVQAQLLDQLQAKKHELESLRASRQTAEQELETARQLPAGVKLEEAQQYLEKEKQFQTAILLAQGSTEETKADTLRLRQELKAIGQSSAILERSLKSHVRFNKSLYKDLQDANRRVKHEQQRIEALFSRKQMLRETLVKQMKTERHLESNVRCRVEMKRRAQSDLRERDVETLHMRKDTDFTRRIHLGELEHAREQELYLQHLLAENRKLKVLTDAAQSSRRLPRADEFDGASGDAAARSELSSTAAVGLDHAIVTSPGGTAAAMAIERPAAAAPPTPAVRSASSPPPKSKERQLLDKFRDYNVGLLQQVVSSMHLVLEQYDAKGNKIPR